MCLCVTLRLQSYGFRFVCAIGFCRFSERFRQLRLFNTAAPHRQHTPFFSHTSVCGAIHIAAIVRISPCEATHSSVCYYCLVGCLLPAAWQPPSVFHGFQNQRIQYEVNNSERKSTNSVKSKLSREKRQRSQENLSTNIEPESQLNQ